MEWGGNGMSLQVYTAQWSMIINGSVCCGAVDGKAL